MQPIYLDNNATTAVDARVVAALTPYLTELYGNPSSLHALGERAATAVAQARAHVARLIGAPARRVLFTSGGSESNQTAISAAASRAGARRRILTSSVEHAAVLEPTAALAARGFEVERIAVDERGRLRLDELERALDERVALVSVMWANNETGVVQDLRSVRELSSRCGALLHVDAVQAVGKLPLDVGASGADFLTLSGHKLHAPKGIGALYVRDDALLEPLIRGGPQEFERRGGTENVPGIVGLGEAARLARQWLEGDGPAQLGELRDSLEDELQERVEGLEFHGRGAPRVPNTSSLRLEGVSGEALTQWLSAEGVCVSTGAACSASRHRPSHVLLAMGLTPAQASGSLRISLSRLTLPQEVERAAELIERGASALRALASP